MPLPQNSNQGKITLQAQDDQLEKPQKQEIFPHEEHHMEKKLKDKVDSDFSDFMSE